jgi:hypothetical protein
MVVAQYLSRVAGINPGLDQLETSCSAVAASQAAKASMVFPWQHCLPVFILFAFGCDVVRKRVFLFPAMGRAAELPPGQPKARELDSSLFARSGNA